MKTYFLVNYSQSNKTLSREKIKSIKSEVQCLINSTSDYSFNFNVALNKQSLHRSQSNLLNINPSFQGSKLRSRNRSTSGNSSLQSGVSPYQSQSNSQTGEPLFYTDLEEESEDLD